jgi:peptidoglycan/LPS O-acetylase OafA/YrhL
MVPPHAQRQLPRPPGNKLLGLEILRFISALAILFWHYSNFTYRDGKYTDFVRENQPFYAVWKSFYDYGHLGVQVFWCISGFIFFWKYRESLSSKIINGKTFFVLRFSRLYPLHVATLLLVALLQLWYLKTNNYFFVFQDNHVADFVLQLFMASNWASADSRSFNGPIWSISLEVLVYVVFFLVLRFVGKSWLISIFMLAICAAAKIFKLTHPIVDCMAFFYIGGLSAILSQSISNKKFKLSLNVLACCFVLLAPVVAWKFKLHEFRYFYTFFLMAFLPPLLFFAAQNFRLNPVATKFIEAAGNMTYSSYLIHFPLQLAIVMIFSALNTPIPLYNQMFFGLFFAVTLSASYLIYRYFELPAQNAIRARFL